MPIRDGNPRSDWRIVSARLSTSSIIWASMGRSIGWVTPGAGMSASFSPPRNPNRCRTLLAIGAPVHALTLEERRRIQLLSALYLVGGPRPVLRPLVHALVGPATGPRTRPAPPSWRVRFSVPGGWGCTTRSVG